MNPADSTSTTNSRTAPSSAGLKTLALVALALLVVAILGSVAYDSTTDPGFRNSAMEKSVRAGLPSGWSMKVTGGHEYSGPCLDACDGSSLQVDLTPPEPRPDRDGQEVEMAAAMQAAGWRYSEQHGSSDPSDAGWFYGAPAATGSRVTYNVHAQFTDGQLSLYLTTSTGD